MTVSSISSTTNPCQISSTDGFGQLFKEFKGIRSAIQSGDMTAAQSAVTTFQNDVQSNTGKNPLSQLFANNSSLGQDLTAIETALKSEDAAGAQDAFKTLMRDLRGAMKTERAHHHHHGHHRVDKGGDHASQVSSSTPTAPSETAVSTNGSPTPGGTLDVQA